MSSGETKSNKISHIIVKRLVLPPPYATEISLRYTFNIDNTLIINQPDNVFFNGHVVINIYLYPSGEVTLVLHDVNIEPKFRGKYFCSQMVTYCLTNAYNFLLEELSKSPNQVGEINGKILIDSDTPEKAYYCYKNGFKAINFEITNPSDGKYYEDEYTFENRNTNTNPYPEFTFTLSNKSFLSFNHGENYGILMSDFFNTPEKKIRTMKVISDRFKKFPNSKIVWNKLTKTEKLLYIWRVMSTLNVPNELTGSNSPRSDEEDDSEPAIGTGVLNIPPDLDSFLRSFEEGSEKSQSQRVINIQDDFAMMYILKLRNKQKRKRTSKGENMQKKRKTGGYRKTKKKRKTLKKKTKKLHKRKFTDTSYPYRNVTKQQAINDFLKLKKLVKGKFNQKSLIGNMTVDYGTEKSRRKTKYRNLSFVDRWKNKTKRKKVIKFAKRLYSLHNPRSVFGSIISAINLQWGTVNTMRPAAAAFMYKKEKAKRVLDFTAGWGARMIAAMALDIDYIGIDSNKGLKKGYRKIINLLRPYTKSKVILKFQKAETVDFSKLPKYDFVFTSPPYEYLEVYENMENYESKGKIKQPSSSNSIKMEDSDKFYKDFLIPTLEKSYKYLPRGKSICLNIPDMMYKKLKSKWRSASYRDNYEIVKRSGSNIGNKRRGKELIYCWKKK